MPSFLQEGRESKLVVGFQQSNSQLLNDARLCPAYVAPAIERTYKNLEMILSCPSSRNFAHLPILITGNVLRIIFICPLRAPDLKDALVSEKHSFVVCKIVSLWSYLFVTSGKEMQRSSETK